MTPEPGYSQGIGWPCAVRLYKRERANFLILDKILSPGYQRELIVDFLKDFYKHIRPE